MDELWSFVDDKGNKQWIWLAIDVATREIVGCYIGDRSKNSAVALWESMPGVYRQCAVIYTDYWEAYTTALPSQRHCAVGKQSGLTSYIERLNNTLRQRVSRLVRKTLSFSYEVGESHRCDLEFYSSLQPENSSEAIQLLIRSVFLHPLQNTTTN
jgi:IS1 family transposase